MELTKPQLLQMMNDLQARQYLTVTEMVSACAYLARDIIEEAEERERQPCTTHPNRES